MSREVHCNDCRFLKVDEGGSCGIYTWGDTYSCEATPTIAQDWHSATYKYVDPKERNKLNDCELFEEYETIFDKLFKIFT